VTLAVVNNNTRIREDKYNKVIIIITYKTILVMTKQSTPTPIAVPVRGHSYFHP